MTRIKITFLITGLHGGGAEEMLYKVLRNINNDNFIIQVISMKDKGVIGEKIENDLSIKVHELNLHKFFHPKKLFKALKLCKGNDIIHGWMYHANLFSLVLGKVLRTKVVWGLHHSDLSSENNKRRTIYLAKLGALFSNQVDKVISCGEIVKSKHLEIGYASHNNLVIPNGFDTTMFSLNKDIRRTKEEFSLKNDMNVLLHVGRWHPLKDYNNLLHAISELKTLRDNFIILLVGKNIDYSNQELVSLIKYYNVYENVQLLGRRENIPDLMAMADLFISSSSGEGFPNVIGEAMSSGTYCIVTNAGDSGNIVGDYGSVVPVNDPNLLAGAINDSLKMPRETYNQIITKARKRVIDKFDIFNITKKHEELYFNLCNNRDKKIK
ncbi:glycosyltransferase [Salibacterium sp. K-3]